jgi:thioredoxin-related protein
MKHILLSLFFGLIYCSPVLGKKSPIKWETNPQRAFEQAKKQDKPLFLYWGAVWCPPCNHIKKTIFSQTAFHKALKDVIPVYIDGDSPDAQTWGEKFQSSGYPTMLLLSSAAKEIYRFPTSSGLNDYLAVFKDMVKSQKSILHLLDKKVEKLTPWEWKILAQYSWGQDILFKEKEEERVKTLSTLYLRSSKENKTSFFMHLLSLYSDKNKNFYKLVAMNKHFVSNMEELLKNKKTINLHWDNLSYYYPEYLETFIEKKNIKTISKKWANQIREIKVKKGSPLKSLSRLSLLTAFERQNTTPKGEENYSKIQDLLKEVKGSYQTHSFYSSATWYYIENKWYSKATKMAEEAIEKLDFDYYYMGYLSMIELKNKNLSKAQEWKKKAWRNVQSNQKATAFQWGSGYVRFLFKERPLKQKEIENTLAELFAHEILFQGRSKRIYKKVQKEYKVWLSKVEEKKQLMIKKNILKICNSKAKSKMCQTNLNFL